MPVGVKTIRQDAAIVWSPRMGTHVCASVPFVNCLIRRLAFSTVDPELQHYFERWAKIVRARQQTGNQAWPFANDAEV
jgi:hypothetical protein